MKIRLASDIHTEFFDGDIDEMDKIALLILPALPDDSKTTLILAGDIGSMHHPECLTAFMDQIAPRFKQVLYIPGNHEYYGGNLQNTDTVILGLVRKHENVFFTENDAFVPRKDGRIVHMATLWTDFDGGDPRTMLEAQMRMNDYRLIRNGNRIAEPADMFEIHRGTLLRLESQIGEGNIVMTHHMPSHRSVPLAYKDQGRINGAYASDLEGLILRKKPALWMHGHTHDACDYMIGDTRILCNPRGYGNQHKKNGYNPTLVVEI